MLVRQIPSNTDGPCGRIPSRDLDIGHYQRMADNPYWDGKIRKRVRFGDPLDPRKVEVRQRAAQRAARARRAKAELEALRAEERAWSF